MTDDTKDPTGELPKLSAKHAEFLDNLIRLKFNATQAYKETYPRSTLESARRLGSLLLTNVDIQAHIKAHFDGLKLSQNEAETILADFARGDLGDFLDDMNIIDLKTAREKGITKLIKKIRQRTVTKIGKKDDDEDVEITDIEIELHDPQAAIDKILRVQGAYKDKSENTTIDLSKLTVNQLKRLRDGENVISVLATPD